MIMAITLNIAAQLSQNDFSYIKMTCNRKGGSATDNGIDLL